MGKSIICLHKKLMKKCRLYELNSIDYDLETSKLKLSNVKESSIKLNECINTNDLSRVLKFKESVICDNIYATNSSECNLTANLCDFNIELRKRYYEEVKIELDEYIWKYKSNLNLIKHVKDSYEELNKSLMKINDKEYFKLLRDREKNLVALYFNIDEFINNGLETVYLISSHSDYWRDKYTVLHLKYEEIPSFEPNTLEEDEKFIYNHGKVAYAHICDFKSNDMKKGNGTLILENLEDMIFEINKRIDYFNKNEHDYYKNKIVSVNGLVCPGDIPFDTLVKFYNKHGYKTYENDKYLYKQIKIG
ncbi:MAG: hypothetical protein RSF67_07760 [Clostridia bacterium]